ncbi:hypothetical protein [Streptomyces sp. ML-6]|uniref:hypothetical protein n=1 Tax=Streptomyces sp. ML-6 TaxID=2982693 RepID=UPI0024BFB705|nr:hypothetical protein [Streptomyces sp. ML-6]MDK0523328.1 hypothetical protein [Streptomyces sp. ML-6]
MNEPGGQRPRGRRGIGAPVALGWLFVLFAMVTCCATPAPSSHGSGAHSTSVAARALTPAHAAPAPSVVADTSADRGMGSSCHGTVEHATPVVLPGQSAPAALPGATVAAPAAPLTGAATIRGPSNDAVRAVDHLRLQVQRV